MDRSERSAYDEAVYYLTRRLRTVAEMRAHLRDKGYAKEEIGYVIDELVSAGYLDDYAYATLYLERGYGKKRGARRLRQELADRGVPADTIETALRDYEDANGIDEFTRALDVARLAAQDMRELGDREQAKIARKLSGLGYSNRDIYKVLAALRAEAAERKLDEDFYDS
ncbi:MAG: regulatory protein RecX [Mogibacterium sp.]|nr:regulatory protein RecX [Mogibacterium sp.]